MWKRTLLVLTLLLATTPFTHAQTTNIDYFNFNDTSSGPAFLTNTGTVRTGVIASNTLTLNASANSTTINAQNGSPAGSALFAPTSNDVTDPNADPTVDQFGNNIIYELQTSSQGYMGLNFSYATSRSAVTGAYTTETISYSTDGNTFTTLSPTVTFSQNNVYQLASYALPTAANNSANLFIDITLTGATATGSGIRIDNLLLSGVATTPAPAGSASALIGLGVLAMAAVTRRRRVTA